MKDTSGLNRGGNEGNKFGAGRKPNAVRQKALDGSDDFLSWCAKVAAGKKVIPVLSRDGSKPNLRYPSFDERMAAGETCLKYGLGTRTDHTSGDEKLNLVVLDV